MQAIDAVIRDKREGLERYDSLRDLREFAQHVAASGTEDGRYIGQEAHRISTEPPVYLHDLHDLRREVRVYLDRLTQEGEI